MTFHGVNLIAKKSEFLAYNIYKFRSEIGDKFERANQPRNNEMSKFNSLCYSNLVEENDNEESEEEQPFLHY